MSPREIDISPEFAAARQALLDALEALRPHEAAVVLVGAQAVYLRTGPGGLPIAEFTTDGDLAIDPRRLADAPPLGELMEAAGFRLTELQGSPEPGIWQKRIAVDDLEIMVPVDLIVPTKVAPPGGTRGARLPRHGRRAARKTSGLEAALVDYDTMSVEALGPNDRRRVRLRVAGVAALLVAKTHKIADRIDAGRTDRLEDKDASDVVRLMQAGPPAPVALKLRALLEDAVSKESTRFAVERFRGLFGNRAGVGIEMAARALRGAMPEERVRAICIAYTETLYSELELDDSPPDGRGPGRPDRPARDLR